MDFQGLLSYALAYGLPAIGAYLIYHWWNRTLHGYFRHRGVPFVEPYPLFGILWPFFTGKMHVNDAIGQGYHQFPEARFSGHFTFHVPGYLIHDPKLVKRITGTDFDHFTDRANNITPEVDPLLGRALVFMNNPHWKPGRTALSPAFTGSKMRNMFTLLSSYTSAAMQRLVKDADGGTLEREMRDLFQRFGNDVMTSISFGVEIDSVHDPDNEFLLKGKCLSSTSGLHGFKLFVMTLLPPKFLTTFGIRIMPKDVTDFYRKIVSDTIKYREENHIHRPDFIHLLMLARKNELSKDASDEKLGNAGFSTVEEHLQTSTNEQQKWSDLDITAAATSFFFGGIETTTTLLCFTLYELSLNLEIQEKLRAEIDSIHQNLDSETLTYECIQEMKFLDMVVTETLRKWPPFGALNRKCTKEYAMENSDGTKVTITKGQIITFSIQAIHRDARYYPDPMRFDPERFAERNRHQLNPDAFLPFGSGPRNCIGSRLALMQAKCFLYYLLVHFSVELSGRTDVPIELDKRAIGMNAKNGFWFRLTPRSRENLR
ncbi:probable cytochrome P450 9f2 [Wyeomyia smithii]|uniref:probable cytochrome P450 9f2 n=1 Tax=Wyeomyia smithii TaxID=174621 RepID=UPI002467D724|nr:probable cytochrome P450 9f2 [Wyeomyia smithii]